jgi:FSR family fosmidomycin resistance protein-like MFS transporter
VKYKAFDRGALGVLTLGHLSSDFFQGAVPALLPFLVRDHGYSYAEAGALFLLASLGSSIVQPLFGLWGDRIRASWLMPAGVLVGGLGIALAGVVQTYALIAGVLFLGGLGVAAFHPEAARFASHVSGDRKGTGMSVFAVGGNAGFALGPILVTPVVVMLGLSATPLLALLPGIAGLLLLARLGALERCGPDRSRSAGSAERAPVSWPVFTLATAAAAARTGVTFGLLAFVPLYFASVLGTSVATGNAAATIMLVTAAAGTLVGGALADRIGFWPVVVWSLAAQVPLSLFLPFADVALAFALLALLGLVMDANFYPLVVIAQRALPGRIGFASGVVLGLSVSIGAGIAALLGVLADAAGLTAVLYAIGGLAALSLALAVPLPRDHGARQRIVAQEA